jgi:hypothetical protein
MYNPVERENPMGYDGMRMKPRGYGMRERSRANYRPEEYPREYPRYGRKNHGDEYSYGGYMDRNNYYEEPRAYHREHYASPHHPHHGEHYGEYHAGKHGYGPRDHKGGYMRDMMGMGRMDGFRGVANWLNTPKVNNFFRGVGLLTVGIILAPTLAKVLRPLAVSTVQGAMGVVGDMKGIVTDAKDEVEDIFAEAKWDEEHEEHKEHGEHHK